MREERTRLQDWSYWGKLECGLCCWEKVDQANICSIHLYEEFVERGAGGWRQQWRQHRYINSDFK